jgi:hypothetical protein
MRRLLHRWFVEYNPLYLLSAMLVLVGLSLLSRASAEQGGVHESLGFVPVLAELYGAALIGGAAFLLRIRQRRPAVMLGLLAVLYQGDLTLLTEREVHLGIVGAVAAASWFALFLAKIRALAWALKLRVSRGFLGVAGAGAAGLALLPRVLAVVGESARDALVAGWLFGLAAAVLWSRREVTSRVPLHAWQGTVLARSLRVTWALWGLLLLGHTAFWSSEYRIHLGVLVPVGLLLATRWIDGELSVWAIVGATLGIVGSAAPGSLWLVALMASAVLALRAAKVRSAAAVARLSGGVVFAVWFAAWTYGWKGGALPTHALPLDLALTVAALALAWRRRTRVVLAPLAFAYLHGAMRAGLVSGPRTSLEWGATAVASGFALLLASLFVGWRLRHGPE